MLTLASALIGRGFFTYTPLDTTCITLKRLREYQAVECEKHSNEHGNTP